MGDAAARTTAAGLFQKSPIGADVSSQRWLQESGIRWMDDAGFCHCRRQEIEMFSDFLIIQEFIFILVKKNFIEMTVTYICNELVCKSSKSRL